jgi:hypothetical protein
MPGRKLKSLEDFQRSLKNGYGLGEGNLYKPWLRVQDVKSEGKRSQIQGIKTGRIHHMMSSIETDFFYIIEYCDSVIDIREQFPLIPINLSIKISEALGIDHPFHPETGEPIVMTTDFLISREVKQQAIYEAVSVKPEDQLGKGRIQEKLEIERVWWQLLGIKFSIFTGSELTRIQSDNISWATHPYRNSKKGFSQHELDMALEIIEPGKLFIEDICNEYIKRISVQHDDALNLLRCLIAKKSICVDLSTPLEGADIINILSKPNVYGDLAIGNS